MITQNDILALLDSKLGLKITKSTLSRYDRQGLIISPYYLKKRNNNQGARRAYYSISVFEIATAASLLSGTDIASTHLNACTDEDVYLGHLLYQLQYRCFADHTNHYYVRSIFNQQSYEFTEQNIVNMLNEYESAKKETPDTFLKIHKQYCCELYKTVFNRMYDILKENIKERETA